MLAYKFRYVEFIRKFCVAKSLVYKTSPGLPRASKQLSRGFRRVNLAYRDKRLAFCGSFLGTKRIFVGLGTDKTVGRYLSARFRVSQQLASATEYRVCVSILACDYFVLASDTNADYVSLPNCCLIFEVTVLV